MDPKLNDISRHIFNLGTGILSQAQRNCLYSSYGYESRLDEGVYGVLQAAQAAELIIKAAIAEKHPLLIFSSLPKSNSVDGHFLSLEDLFEGAKTVQYTELPEKLWAVTGYKIVNVEIYQSFGKLRNCIQHFTIPSSDIRIETSDFIYKVIDPILEHFWGDFAIEYVDLESYIEDVFDILKSRGLKVRYPDSLREHAEKVYLGV